jgi:hypothetical protein
MEIARCPSCEGYGWVSDFEEGDQDCAWCAGIGYVYRDERGTDRPIPVSDLPGLVEQLEALELARLREIGYTGAAKKPWEQAIRQERGILLNGDDTHSDPS